MCTATLGDGNDVNMVIRPKAEVVLLGAMVTHALIWMVGLKSCALDVPFVRENTHSSRNLVENFVGDRGSLFTKEKLLDSQCFG